MKKRLRNDKENLAQIKTLLGEQSQQINALTKALEQAAAGPAGERRSKSKGPLGIAVNYFFATGGDLRQSINQFIFPILGYAFLQYYLRHMNSVWGAALMSLLIGIPIIIFARMLWGFRQERQRAFEGGGALAVYDVQFRYGLIFALAAIMMFVFGNHSGPRAASTAEGSAAMLTIGGLTVAYNYWRGRKLAAKESRDFPSLLKALRDARKRRGEQLPPQRPQ